MKKRFSVKNVILVYSIITFFVAAISFAVSFYFSRAVNLGSEEGDEHYDKYYVMITSEKDSDFGSRYIRARMRQEKKMEYMLSFSEITLPRFILIQNL